MAVTKFITSTSLVMEVKSGTDDEGKALYKKRSYGDIKPNADVNDIHAVASEIAKVLANETKDFFISETSRLEASEE